MTNVYYWPFEFGRKTKANEQLQRVLADYGYYPGEIDGIFGTRTKLAVEDVQRKYNLPMTGEIDRATEDLLFPGNYERRTPSMQITSNWLSGIVASTAFKYILQSVATAIAVWLGLEGDVVLAILTQVIGLIPMLWGAWEAAKSKIVVNGKAANLANAPADLQRQAVSLVAQAKNIPERDVVKAG